MLRLFTNFTVIGPTIVAVLYLLTALAFAHKRDWVWALVWFSYAVANVGLLIVSMRGT